LTSAETILPNAAPSRVIAPLKWPKRCSVSAASEPATVLLATVSSCATRLAVAVSKPERCTCHASLSSTQPEYIAKRGTSGMPVSIDIDGRVQEPDWKVCV